MNAEIPIGLVKAIATNEHVPHMFAGQDTHNPALNVVMELVKSGHDEVVIVDIIRNCLPLDYDGNFERTP